MQYVNLGKTGLKVSRICLGMMSYGTPAWREWVLTEDEGRPFIQRALDLGINFFDTADIYSLGVSEEVTGRALKAMARRDEIVIATKVFFPMSDRPNRGGLSRKHIMDSIDASLQRLGTDYIDLYQIHRWDPNTPIEETLEALHDVVKAGKARYIGASSMFAWQFTKSLYLADWHGWTRFVSMQNHYNLIYREEEREMIPLCTAEGIGIIPWSPLARGLLARPAAVQETTRSGTDTLVPQLYGHPTDGDIITRVSEVATRLGMSQAKVALAWLLHQPGVTAPIVGATKMHHLEQAVEAVDVALADADLDYLEELYQPRAVKGIGVRPPRTSMGSR